MNFKIKFDLKNSMTRVFLFFNGQSLSKCSSLKSTLFALHSRYVYDISKININITYLVVPTR